MYMYMYLYICKPFECSRSICICGSVLQLFQINLSAFLHYRHLEELVSTHHREKTNCGQRSAQPNGLVHFQIFTNTKVQILKDKLRGESRSEEPNGLLHFENRKQIFTNTIFLWNHFLYFDSLTFSCCHSKPRQIIMNTDVE